VRGPAGADGWATGAKRVTSRLESEVGQRKALGCGAGLVASACVIRPGEAAGEMGHGAVSRPTGRE
jgi:hypothetical protein